VVHDDGLFFFPFPQCFIFKSRGKMSYRKGFKLLSPLFFSVSTLKSVFGREDESAMLTRNTKCGKKSGIRQVRGARSTSTFIQEDDCTAR
jgi:hypothetical protein